MPNECESSMRSVMGVLALRFVGLPSGSKPVRMSGLFLFREDPDDRGVEFE